MSLPAVSVPRKRSPSSPVSYTHLDVYKRQEYERTLVEALEEENVFRQIAKVIQTSSGDRKIPVVAAKPDWNRVSICTIEEGK